MLTDLWPESDWTEGRMAYGTRHVWCERNRNSIVTPRPEKSTCLPQARDAWHARHWLSEREEKLPGAHPVYPVDPGDGQLLDVERAAKMVGVASIRLGGSSRRIGNCDSVRKPENERRRSGTCGS